MKPHKKPYAGRIGVMLSFTTLTLGACALEPLDARGVAIFGFVSEANAPAPGTRVRLTNDDGTVVAIADDDGLFTAIAPPGIYTVYAEREESEATLMFDTSEETGLIISLSSPGSENTGVVQSALGTWNFYCMASVFKTALTNPKINHDPTNHCYASCEIRRFCGVSLTGTALLGVAKEVCDKLKLGPYCHDFSWNDLWADLKGIACSYSWKSCYSCCPK